MLFSKKQPKQPAIQPATQPRRRPVSISGGIGSGNSDPSFRRPQQPMQAAQPARPGRNPSFRTPAAGQNRTFSYYASRSQTDLNVGREAAQSKPPLRRLPGKVQKIRRHFGWLLVGILALGVVMYEMQLSTDPKIVSLSEVSDEPFLQQTSVYEAAASKLFKSSATNRNKLTVNSAKIAADLEKAFPELDDVSVSLPMVGDQATVYIHPANPSMVLVSQNGSFVLDDQGRALATAGAQVSSLRLPSVTDQSGLQVAVGKAALPRSATQFISDVVAQLKAQRISVQSMTLPSASSELDVYIAGEPYFVKFNIHNSSQESAKVQAGTYVAMKKWLEGQRIVPGQYVDVRIEGRAYYK